MSTKLQETINSMGGNIKPMLDELKQLADEVDEIEAEIANLNDKKNEKRSRAKAIGISKKAFDFGRKRKNMDPDEREKLDDNYTIVCEALGVPLPKQEDFFEKLETQTENENANEEDNTGPEQAKAVLEAGE